MENKNQKDKKKGNPLLGLIAVIVLVVILVVSCGGNKDCELCHGDKVCQKCCKMGDQPGKCWVCDGEGSFEGSFYTPCSECDGTGDCTSCNGTGKCERCGGSGKER